MSNLLVKQVKYFGEKYSYSSPILTSGINILEGENGAGKTTFSSLLYFGLGGNVKWFREDTSEKHIEITSDKSNYVEITIIIDDHLYIVTRYIYKFEVNIVSPTDVITLPINRSINNTFTFSDWLLGKLNITVVEIYQGSEFYKLNFLDLFRLMYHDQITPVDKIYKRPDNENYMSDSGIIRKAIFEILTGNSFEEYYNSIANYRKALDEQATMKSLVQNFEYLNVDSSTLFEGKNSYNLNLDLNELLSQIEKLETYRESINDNVTSIKTSTEVLSQKRQKFSEYEEKVFGFKKDKSNIVLEYSKVKRVRENVVLEVTHLKKIIITNENLNLFSPDTCPICLKNANREPERCICGNEVTDEQYQKFFYTKEEYFNILKSKQKNIETLDIALKGYEDDIKYLSDKISLFEHKLEEIRGEISQLTKGRRVIKNIELKEVNDKILELEKKISQIRQQIKIELKREELESKRTSFGVKVEDAKRIMDEKKIEASKSMDDIVKSFSNKYLSLMSKALHDCNSARISSDDYMPIINGGTYKEASSNVSKRLMYYLTLFHLSLVDKIKFPKFLLIDTPENMGIDNDNFISAMLLINELGDERNSINKGQIIVTTGLNKYPDQFKEYIFQTIDKKNKLLIKNAFDIGA
ncbi:AAA family ATPase [Flavobacterium suzhouense]|uniref:AAA family ATPase n=1 Tax=Flavobacterium suzhouense TaxID=1529638 RepID=A0ABW5NXQ2_9FLAO